MARYLNPIMLGVFSVLIWGTNGQAQTIMAGDVVIGLGSGDGLANVELARGPASEMGGVNVPMGWNQDSLQSIEFDNLNGISHNPQGNLLGASFSGGAPSGGAIFSLGTCSTASETIGNTVGMGGAGVSETPLGGLSVSPDNSKIAVVGYNTGSVIVYDYTAGDCSGEGASLSNGRQTEEGVVVNFTTTGTTWLDNNNVLTLSAAGDVLKVDATTMESEVIASVDTVAAGSQFTDSEYNPVVAPYLYLSYSTFNAGSTTNQLFVLDPRQDFAEVLSVDLSESSQTAREIALSAEGHLFIGQFGAPVDILLNAGEADFDDNASLDWYTPINSSSFSGLDVAVGLPITTPGMPCDFNGDDICDLGDIDQLTAEIIAGTHNADFDLTGDGNVDIADQDEWRSDAASRNGFAAPYLNGDADLDGSVVAGDLNALGTNWQSSPNAWSRGDFNADGAVDAGDLNLLALNWQDSVPMAGSAAAVPEPAAATILMAAGVVCCLSLRRIGREC